MTKKIYEKPERIYWDSLGFSQLSVFLDLNPPIDSSKFLWHLKRKTAQFFTFIFSPIFISVHIWSILSASPYNLKQISFDLGFLSHNVQNLIKMFFWLTNLTSVRDLCLDFSQFHVNRYRPLLSSWVLQKESNVTRKYIERCFLISKGGLIIWVFIPTSIALINYFLYVSGLSAGQETYIPRLSVTQFPFNMSYLGNRLFVGTLEYGQMISVFIYYQPIDMFLIAAVNMVRTQYLILNFGLFWMPKDLEAFWGTEVSVKDTEPPMDMRLFVEDHQRLVRYGQKLREVLNPVLGIVTFDCIILMCNCAIFITKLLEDQLELLELVLYMTAYITIILASLVVFYTFSSMSGMLKEAEESVFDALYAQDWYRMSTQKKRSMIFIRKQTITARKIPMLNLGDMDRATFIEGLRAVYTFYHFAKQFK
uniref:Odorant receptor n=1 Tax=Adelphocoris lineolatus TaxID=236346 RepID=A0A2I4PHN8_ADELI|nr:olfactory receptor 84 [Adelphocoris lineolatus]